MPVPELAAGKDKAMPMPDFTKGATLAKDSPHDWTLGADRGEQVERVDKCIAAIESSTATPTLVSVAEFKARPAK